MAEGDTIHRLAGRLEVALAGQPVTAFTAPAARSPLRLQAERLARAEGSIVTSVEARGKHLLIELGPDLVLHSHLGMKGSWRIARDVGGISGPLRRAWAVIETPRAAAAQFGGPVLALRTPAELARDRRLSRLGPDVLGPGFDPEQGAERLLELAAVRPLGEALLDQRMVSGIGNVLKSEACWSARVDPFATVGSYDRTELAELLRITQGLMNDAVASGQRSTRVYKKRGRPCGRCGTAIKSAPQGDGNRLTFWCPSCQGPG